MYWNLKDIVSAKFGSTSLKLWKLLTIFVIWLLENTFISDLKITLGAAGTVANSLATPTYQYERLVLKYFCNIRCIYWISFKYCYSKHLGLSQYTQGASISSQRHAQGTWNTYITPIETLKLWQKFWSSLFIHLSKLTSMKIGLCRFSIPQEAPEASFEDIVLKF